MNIFLLLFLFLSFINAPDFSGTTGEKKPSALNILFIAIDDLRPALGCYGKDYIHSPNIDKLAAQGTVFTNHFVQVPTCGASRYSMLTGMLPRNKSQLSNDACRQFISGKPESEKPETFIHQLRRNGYYTVGIGKISHYADGLLYRYTDPVGTERELPNSWDELLFNRGKWGTGWEAFFAYANGESRISLHGQVKPYEKGDVDDEGYPDGLTAALALKKLNELADKGQPFFLGVGFFKPHLPFNAPKKYWDLYDEKNIPLAPFPDIPENVNPASLHNSREFSGYFLGDEKAALDHPVSDTYAKKLRHAYFACVSYTDAQVGKLLDELERLGLAENTIVVIWGDHGWHLGDQRIWGKHTIFERALKSVLLIKAPGTKSKGRKIERIVSSVDLYPTLMELTGLKMPYEADGHSLVPLMRKSQTKKWKDVSYGYFRNGISMRTPRYRLTRYFRDEQPVIELYDHESDPWETKNIAGERPEVVKELMPLWEAGDTGLYQ